MLPKQIIWWHKASHGDHPGEVTSSTNTSVRSSTPVESSPDTASSTDPARTTPTKNLLRRGSTSKKPPGPRHHYSRGDQESRRSKSNHEKGSWTRGPFVDIS